MNNDPSSKYLNLLNGVGIVWSIHTKTLVCSFANSSADILGFSPDIWKIEPDFLIQRVHPDDRVKFQQAIDQVKNGLESMEFEHRFVHHNEKIVWALTALRSGEEIQGLSIDITRLKESETALRRSRDRAGFFANASLILGETLDPKTTLERLGWLTVPELADWCLIDLFEHGSFRSVVIANADPDLLKKSREMRRKYPLLVDDFSTHAKVFHTGKSEMESVASTHAHESLKMLKGLPIQSWLVVPLKARGQILGVLTLVTDTPGVHFDDQNMREAEGLAVRASVALDNAKLYEASIAAVSARDEFLSIASHELKTPLTSLKMQLEIANRHLKKSLQEGTSPITVQRSIAISSQQVNRLTLLIEELLNVSRIESGKLEFSFSAHDLHLLVHDIADRFRDEFHATQTELSIESEPNVIAYCDRFRMEQVLVNLLNNALKYAPGKPVKIQVARSGNSAIIQIEDQGPGIPIEKQSKVFERYERAVSHNNVSGLGLGLYISQKIAEGHRGRIRLQSELGQGSRFIVEIPAEVEI